jgi:hypothetical protein
MRHGDIANSGIFEFKLAVYTFKNPLGHGHLEGATVRKRISRTLPYQRIGRKAIEVRGKTRDYTQVVQGPKLCLSAQSLRDAGRTVPPSLRKEAP